MQQRDEWLRPHQIYSDPGKPGLLPIKRTAFYAWMKNGMLPPPDAVRGRIRLWRRSTIENFLKEAV